MELVEISEKQQLSREEAAGRLHALADAMAKHNEVEFERGGMRIKVHVPDLVSFKLEVEVEDVAGTTEIRHLVFPCAWRSPPPSVPRPPSRRTPVPLRSAAACRSWGGAAAPRPRC